MRIKTHWKWPSIVHSFRRCIHLDRYSLSELKKLWLGTVRNEVFSSSRLFLNSLWGLLVQQFQSWIRRIARQRHYKSFLSIPDARLGWRLRGQWYMSPRSEKHNIRGEKTVRIYCKRSVNLRLGFKNGCRPTLWKEGVQGYPDDWTKGVRDVSVLGRRE